MTTNPAKSPRRTVVFVIYPEIALLDLAGPLQVFAWARFRGTGDLAYDVAIASSSTGAVQTDTILSADAKPMKTWRNQAVDTLVIVGGDGVYDMLRDGEFINDLKTLVDQSTRVCSVCSGALALAATGQLDGRRAVTHWDDCDALAKMFPEVRVERDPIYLKDGNIWTSAGVTSGIDMALAIVAEDLGQEAAMERAQALVTYMVRPGNQSQFSPTLGRQMRDRSGRFGALHAWIAENLAQDLRTERLAEKVNLSLRTFHRLHVEATGQTPAKTVQALRLELARDLLETTEMSLKAIASQSGFQEVHRMRRAFLRDLGVPPQIYRERFQPRHGRNIQRSGE